MSIVIFNTIIHKENLTDFSKHNYYLKNKAHNIKKNLNDKFSTDWRCDTFNTLNFYNPIEDNDSVVNNLIYIVSNKIKKIAVEYGVNESLYDVKCVDFWFNISSHGNYQEYHQHSNSHFSVVYYVNSSKNCGNIVFKNAEAITDMFPLPVENSCINLNSAKTHYIIPKESDLLIFRSNLMHMVEKNYSDDDRISISMNFVLVPKLKNYIHQI
jgi:uncharacterized protein (TIGR02466 family)